MPFLKSMPERANPGHVFQAYPDIYGPWSEMSQAMMNGPSPLSQGEREMILAYAAGVANCEFVYIAHSEVAYAWGVKEGLIELMLEDLEKAPLSEKIRPLMFFVKKLMINPASIAQEDVDSVMTVGWNEQALQDTKSITSRADFMQRIVHGHGFTPMPRSVAERHAHSRVEKGYVNIFPKFAHEQKD
jgi:alkylhydroperoxidase family enzyme